MATINVNAGDDLQAAINAANRGDTLLLQAGATWTGPITLPVKTSGSGYVQIKSSCVSCLVQFPRALPEHAPFMPKIVAPGYNEPAIRTAPGAHHYNFVGIEVAPKDAGAAVSTLVNFGDGSSAQNSLSLVPTYLYMDRCYVHGLPGAPCKRGIGLHSKYSNITNCTISDIKGVGYDTQAICGWNGPGQYKILNCYLEAAGENVMFGGADPSIANLIPSDITIDSCHFSKPLSWRVGDPSYAGIHWSVKNLFEIKNAQRVTLTNNLFENCWADAQAGFAIVLKAVQQSGLAPWSACQDIVFRDNVVRHSACAVLIAGQTQKARRLTIANNLFDDISREKWGGDQGWFLQLSSAETVLIDHNTVFQTGSIMTLMDDPTTGLVCTNNIFPHNAYGVFGVGVGSGTNALNRYCPGAQFQRNVITGHPDYASGYPADNAFPASMGDVGFVDYAGGDYRLTESSPYHLAALDGQDIGYIG